MAERVGFPFPSLPLNEGRTYGQPEVVLISLPQVATGLRLRLHLIRRRTLMYYVMVYPKWNMGNYIKSDKHFIRAKITFCVIIYGNEMYKSGFDQEKK